MTARCPHCSVPLTGGPVLFWCVICDREVRAADVEHEYSRLVAAGRLP